MRTGCIVESPFHSREFPRKTGKFSDAWLMLIERVIKETAESPGNKGPSAVIFGGGTRCRTLLSVCGQSPPAAYAKGKPDSSAFLSQEPFAENISVNGRGGFHPPDFR